MILLAALLSATFTFSATATGVEKGTAIEFFFAGANTDRAYEAMFLLEEPIEVLCSRFDAAVPHGSPVDVKSCRLWPTGCRVSFDPPLDTFVKMSLPEKGNVPVPIYTGGMRKVGGTPVAADVMPASFFSTYSLSDSPVVFSEPFNQGAVYGCFTAQTTLEKGKKYSFKLTIDEETSPKKVNLTAEKGQLKSLILALRDAAAGSDVDACVSFSENLTVGEAISTAQALASVDSLRVKINGSSNLFYRAFLPLEKWRDRQERLHQPFELTLEADGTDKLFFIEEDWSVEGNDPRLTPRLISYKDSICYADTDTCFIFTSPTQTLDRVTKAVRLFSNPRITNWYVYTKD